MSNFVEVPSGDSPLMKEITHRWMFMAQMSMVLDGMLIPLESLMVLTKALRNIKNAKDKDMIPVMVGLDCIALCIFSGKHRKWYISPLFGVKDGVDPADAAAGLTIAIFDLMEATKDRPE